MTASRSLWRGRLALFATVIIWSSPPIFQYWLAASFDTWTQNFYRSLAGFFVMAPFLLWIAWRAPRRIPAADWAGCALAALPNVVHQIAQTMAVVLLWPGVYALLGRLSVVFTAVLAMIFFADERWIARSGKFQAGTVFAMIGVAGLVWAPGQGMSGAETWIGLLLALAAALAWALYGVLVKKFTLRSGPTLGFGVVSFLTMLLLLCPLGTMLLSSALFGETFRFEQIFAGAVLLLGAFLALSARPPAIEEPA